ncbi:MAG: ribbon-helix-helix protein, CopG family [Candidatus Lokiarchaeota archaeon]|nr:ribbon-helix-helix protein, CopG family [Candidatus Lokiarchaeota archaeon]
MKLITVHVPEAYLNAIDQLISADAYPNRSEAIRVAIRDLLKNELGGFIRFSQANAAVPEL